MSDSKSDQIAQDVTATASEIRILVGRLRRRLRQQAHAGDFTPSQILVLLYLEKEGPATVTTLAKAEGVRPQSMGATVAVLQEVGFVSGTADPNDGRQILLSLTDRARKEIAANRAAREDWLSQTIRATLSKSEQRELARGVELLKRLADS